MRILMLCHVHEMFNHVRPEYIQRVLESLDDFDMVVHFSATGICEDMITPELDGIPDRYIEMDWGYHPNEEYEIPDDAWFTTVTNEDLERAEWIIPSHSANGYAWIPEELRNPSHWEGQEITVGGGYFSECLADLESVLTFMGIKYDIDFRLVYG